MTSPVLARLASVSLYASTDVTIRYNVLGPPLFATNAITVAIELSAVTGITAANWGSASRASFRAISKARGVREERSSLRGRLPANGPVAMVARAALSICVTTLSVQSAGRCREA